jgi:TRAP-type uncharacterized transport system substrate-binding protein
MGRLWIALVSALVLAVAAGAWMHYFRAPPVKIVMATGTKSLAYYTFGQRYKAALRHDGLDVVVQDTRGSLENLEWLHHTDPTRHADVALIQGGIVGPNDSASDLESLGTVFYEPLWLFRRRAAANEGPPSARGQTGASRIEAAACRHGRHGIVRYASIDGINRLRGRTIAIGPNGSGIQPLVCELLRLHGITRGISDLRPMDTKDAVAALSNGAIDAAFIVASFDAPDVQKLLHDPDLELVGYPQADAYADYYPYLHKVTMHRGAIDFASDQPPADVTLIATKASLIVRKDLPSAIKYLLLNAAMQIHGQRNILQRTDEFPSAEAGNPPLSLAAQQFYKPGLPYYLNSLLLNNLPFWIAGPVNALLIPVLILVTTLGVVAPLIRLVPVLYAWATQRPVIRLLFEVMALEAKLDLPGGEENAGEVARRLKELDRQVTRRLTRGVPATLTAPLLILRQHIDALRKRLERYG